MRFRGEWIFPAAALVLACGWLAWWQRSISETREETESLRERIASARAGELEERGGRSAPNREGHAQTERFDRIVKEFARSFRVQQRSTTSGAFRLQRAVSEMDASELRAFLDHLETVDLPRQAKARLEVLAVRVSRSAHPEVVLEQYAERTWPGTLVLNLKRAFDQWFDSDPEAARRWFDERVAAGDFERKSLDESDDRRVEFEGKVMSSLLEENPARVEERLSGLPTDQRVEVMERIELGAASRREFADLVRRYLPENERTPALFSAIRGEALSGRYETVDSFLNDIEGTAGERSGLVKRVAKSRVGHLQRRDDLHRERVAGTRAWLMEQEPEDADMVLGRILGDYGTTATDESGEPVVANFMRMRRFVEEVHASGGGDDVLVGFLSGYQAEFYREEAIKFAAWIENDARRREVLERLEAPDGEDRAD